MQLIAEVVAILAWPLALVVAAFFIVPRPTKRERREAEIIAYARAERHRIWGD